MKTRKESQMILKLRSKKMRKHFKKLEETRELGSNAIPNEGRKCFKDEDHIKKWPNYERAKGNEKQEKVAGFNNYIIGNNRSLTNSEREDG